jgi:hypothetical protein
MAHVHRHRRLPLLHVLVLGLLALGLVLQPVIAAVGEIHELGHDPSGMHSHDPHADHLHAVPTAAGGNDPDGSETLHALLDFAHCCGAAAMVVPVLDGPSVLVASRQLASARVFPPPAVRLPSPFKPPIYA